MPRSTPTAAHVAACAVLAALVLIGAALIFLLDPSFLSRSIIAVFSGVLTPALAFLTGWHWRNVRGQDDEERPPLRMRS